MCLEIALKAWPLVTFCCFGRNKWTKKLRRSLESGVVKTTMCSTGRSSKQGGRSILTCCRKGGINGYRWVPMEWVPVSAASCQSLQSPHSPLHRTATLSTHIPNTNWTAYHCDMLTLPNSCMMLYGFHACVAGQPVHHRWARCYPQVRAIRGV